MNKSKDNSEKRLADLLAFSMGMMSGEDRKSVV